jgi:hypothetical protein
MTISADGWIDGAIRMPGRPVVVGEGFNAGINSALGLVFHSAEGFAATMLSPTSQWGYYSAEYPWHLSNLLDGRLIQHYSLHVRCWHGSAFNDSYVGMEHEGLTPEGASSGPSLNLAQVTNDRYVIRELSQWKGWQPKRPTSLTDKTATLYEHTEVRRFGGTGTQCPSNRIPWGAVLLEEPMPEAKFIAGDANAGLEVRYVGASFTPQIVVWVAGKEVWAWGDPEGQFPEAVAKQFPDGWEWLRRSDIGEAMWSRGEGN